MTRQVIYPSLGLKYKLRGRFGIVDLVRKIPKGEILQSTYPGPLNGTVPYTRKGALQYKTPPSYQ